ncbi:MAG: Asp-tRNA(Asn)/Glu-tRNA(Gln) amidotransferase subunit GatC [Alphaproteobacteria bacterium]|nr:Asp-tRNA(Asn)/Glu-tRNA(Gln) amidotransferase subunit GatC [Alphaproteobacteria bacterium]
MPMPIDKDMVKRLGILSRLSIPEENTEEMVTEIKKIISWVDQLKDVNTDDVLPMNSVVEDMDLPERKDEITDGDIRDAVIKNAPDQMDGYFLVPKVVE